jgi:hypothetical protein
VSLLALVAGVVLETLPPSAAPSSTADATAGGHGFAAYIIGGFFALGLIMLVAVVLSRRPRSAPR